MYIFILAKITIPEVSLSRRFTGLIFFFNPIFFKIIFNTIRQKNLHNAKLKDEQEYQQGLSTINKNSSSNKILKSIFELDKILEESSSKFSITSKTSFSTILELI